MSDTIGPVYVKERPGAEMQSRIDAEVCTKNFSALLCSNTRTIFINILKYAGGEALERSL